MTITLVRHAPVKADWSIRLRANELSDWIEAYDRSSIDIALPDGAVSEKIQNSDYVVSSDMPRALESLKVVGVEANLTDSIFAEAPLPVKNWKILRLKPMQWLTLFRVMWLLGWLKGDSSFDEAKNRAKNGASKLEALAKIHNNICLMGHGGMNAMIVKELKHRSWKQIEKGGGIKNWSYVVLKK